MVLFDSFSDDDQAVIRLNGHTVTPIVVFVVNPDTNMREVVGFCVDSDFAKQAFGGDSYIFGWCNSHTLVTKGQAVDHGKAQELNPTQGPESA